MTTRVAIYARVSTDVQEARGTIGSQLAVLRERVAGEGHELVAEYTDEGVSGARLDRPGLDALRDAAEAGQIEGVWCLSADRLARMYAYQVIVLDELSRHGVVVWFHDTPPIEDDPQARLLTQVQGVIAEYERAKIAVRYRRGKLWRTRAGEVVAWKAPYGYRRIARGGGRPARLEVFEHEAAVVRRIFDDYVRKDLSMRRIAKGLNQDGVRSPAGRDVWSVSTIGRILRNEAYVGRVYYNRTEAVPQRGRTGRTRQMARSPDQWIAIPVPAVLKEDLFEAAQRVSRDNSRWSPRRAEPGHWLLRGLVKCGHCGVGVSCHKMRGRNGTVHRYYYCRNHDPLRAGGEDRRCPERNIRADELDAFVFERVRDTLLRPDVLLAGAHAVSARRKPDADELVQAQLAKLQRRIDAVAAERRRLADLYQGDFIDRGELLRRGKELQERRKVLHEQGDALRAQREQLAQHNAMRQRIAGFSSVVHATIDHLDFEQRQKLLRLVVDQVCVSGWRVEIKLQIPSDEPPAPPGHGLSSKDRLRSVHIEDRGAVHQAVDGCERHGLVGEDRAPLAERLVGSDEHRAILVARADEFEQHAGFGLILPYIGDVVEDEEVVLVEFPDGGFERQFAPSDLQPLDEVGGARVEDTEAVLDKRQADRGRQMALAATRIADEYQVGTLVEPAVAGDQRVDMGLGDHGDDVELEVGQRLARRQPGFRQMAFEAPSGALGDLLFDQGREQSGRRPSFLVGAFGERLPHGFDGRQPQFRQHQIDLRGIDGAHDAPAAVACVVATGSAESRTS